MNKSTFLRQITMLKIIPKYPSFALTRDIYQRLIDENFKTSKRTVERDLHKLANLMGLICSDSPKGYKWAYINNAREVLPALSQNEAFSVMQAKQYLANVMPLKTLHPLEPVFNIAESTLEKDNTLAPWQDKIKVLPASLPLVYDDLNQEIHEQINEAVLKEEQIDIVYCKSSGEIKNYGLNTYGLIIKNHIQYLVASKQQTPDTIQIFKLAAIKSVKRNFRENQACDTNISKYLNTQTSKFLVSDKPITLEMNIAGPVYTLLKYAKLSNDQIIREFKGIEHQSCGLLTATVKLTDELVHFLLGYGKWVEVISPPLLIDEMNKLKTGDVFRYKRNK